MAVLLRNDAVVEAWEKSIEKDCCFLKQFFTDRPSGWREDSPSPSFCALEE